MPGDVFTGADAEGHGSAALTTDEAVRRLPGKWSGYFVCSSFVLGLLLISMGCCINWVAADCFNSKSLLKQVCKDHVRTTTILIYVYGAVSCWGQYLENCPSRAPGSAQGVLIWLMSGFRKILKTPMGSSRSCLPKAPFRVPQFRTWPNKGFVYISAGFGTTVVDRKYLGVCKLLVLKDLNVPPQGVRGLRSLQARGLSASIIITHVKVPSSSHEPWCRFLASSYHQPGKAMAHIAKLPHTSNRPQHDTGPAISELSKSVP